MEFGLCGVKLSLQPRYNMKKTGLFALVVIILISCQNEPDCFQLNNSQAVVYFKILGGGNDQVPITSITTPGTDSTFYDDELVSFIALPLNPKVEETLFTITTPEGVNKLHFGYKRQIQFVSEACGERFYYQGLNVLEHDYDSVRVVNDIPAPSPLPSGAKNIEVFRCAVTNLMGLSFPAATKVESITSDFAAIELPADGMLSDFVLPLNPEDSVTTFEFDFGDEVSTLKVRYGRKQKTFAKICSAQWLLYDLHINGAVTDLPAEILKDSIQDLPVINLEITPP